MDFVTKSCSLLLVTAIALLLAGCGGSSENTSKGSGDIDADVQQAYDKFVTQDIPGLDVNLVQKAKDEGAVVFYSSTGGALGELGTTFHKWFPFIKVEQLQLSGGILNERYQAEKSKGLNTIDVFTSSSEPAGLEFAKAGYCSKYTPTVDDKYPGSAKTVPGEMYRFYGLLHGIAFMEGSLSQEDVDALGTWSTLMDDRWSGKTFGMLPPTAGGGSQFVNTYFYREFGTKLWQKHKEIAGDIQLFASTGAMMQSLIRGEIEMTDAAGLFGPYDSRRAGAKVQWVVPTPLLAVPAPGCISSEPPHPNAARLLWEFILSNKGQEIMDGFGSVSYKTDFDAGPREEFQSLPWYEPPDTSNIYDIPVDQLTNLQETVDSKWEKVFAK